MSRTTVPLKLSEGELEVLYELLNAVRVDPDTDPTTLQVVTRVNDRLIDAWVRTTQAGA